MRTTQVILNGGFETDTVPDDLTSGNIGTSTTANWVGQDLEILESTFYIPNSEANGFAVELDGNVGQTTTVSQTFTLGEDDINGGGLLEFDLGVRSENGAGDLGQDGALVTITDSGGQTIFSMTVLPTEIGVFQPFAFEIDFPAAGDYTITFAEVGNDNSLGAVLDNVSLLVCFAAGAMIATPEGERPVESLEAGDLVLTRDNGPQPIRWAGKRRVGKAEMERDPRLRPILFQPGALGEATPSRPMRVSPLHRVLVTGQRAVLMFGEYEILVAAKALLNDRDILVDHAAEEVEYVHILFDRHEIITADGAPAESFLPNATARNGLEAEMRDELLRLFPELEMEEWSLARPEVPVTLARALSAG